MYRMGEVKRGSLFLSCRKNNNAFQGNARVIVSLFIFTSLLFKECNPSTVNAETGTSNERLEVSSAERAAVTVTDAATSSPSSHQTQVFSHSPNNTTTANIEEGIQLLTTAAATSSAEALPALPTTKSNNDFSSNSNRKNEIESDDNDNAAATTEGTSSSENLVLKLDRDYTPLEIAEYIYSTGDEKGISQSVYEMVQDGQIMLSQDDIILFLEAVQMHLEEMRRKGSLSPEEEYKRRKIMSDAD